MEFKEDYYDCGHPDAPGPKHIWDGPGYNKKGPNNNFWGLHIWRVCNHYNISMVGYHPATWTGQSTCDWPGVNTYTPNTVGPFYFWGTPGCQRYWNGSAWAFNVTAPTPSGYLPLQDYYHTNYFYDWAVHEVGPINVGDKIEWNCCEQQAPYISTGGTPPSGEFPTPFCVNNTLGGSGSGNKICLEYLGRHYIGGHPLIPPGPPNWGLPTPVPWPIYIGQYYWDGTYMSTSVMSASVYSMQNYPEENPTCCKSFEHDTSWDCVQIGDHPKFGHKCVEIYGISGQYETKQECLNSPCSQEAPLDPGTTGPPGGFSPFTGGGIGSKKGSNGEGSSTGDSSTGGSVSVGGSLGVGGNVPTFDGGEKGVGTDDNPGGEGESP